jgi:hypothetical protein
MKHLISRTLKNTVRISRFGSKFGINRCFGTGRKENEFMAELQVDFNGCSFEIHTKKSTLILLAMLRDII